MTGSGNPAFYRNSYNWLDLIKRSVRLNIVLARLIKRLHLVPVEIEKSLNWMKIKVSKKLQDKFDERVLYDRN